jgi:hypothetical protein
MLKLFGDADKGFNDSITAYARQRGQKFILVLSRRRQRLCFCLWNRSFNFWLGGVIKVKLFSCFVVVKNIIVLFYIFRREQA